MKKIKVGFLINDLNVDFYVLELIKHTQKSNLYFDPIIIHGFKKKNFFLIKRDYIKEFRIFKVLDKLLITFILWLIKFIEKLNVKKRYPNYLKSFNLENLLDLHKINVDGAWSKNGLYLEFDKKELEIISKENLDCIIKCSDEILRGKILNLPKFGILSIYHGDNRFNRGGPSGFWEVIKNEPSSGFIIQRLNNQLSEGDVLLRGNIMTESNFTTNHAQLLEKSNFFFKKILDKLALTGRLEIDKSPVFYNKNTLKIKNSTILFKYLYKVFFPLIIKKIVQKLLKSKKSFWSVAYQPKLKNENFLENLKKIDKFKEIENPKNRFLADPFVFSFKERNIIFVEDYSFKKNKGSISAIEIKLDTEQFLGTVLEEDFHLSFPFIFESGNDIYMIPETSQINEIRLYKCNKFPTNWRLESILMKNVSAADTMLIKQDSTWFMLTNICSSNIGDHQSELHIFYNDKFSSNDWKPIHQGNPVIFDSNKARNGGMFFFNNKLYRINQIHGKAHYGKSFGINEVLSLNKNIYIEKRIKNIDPNFKNQIIGTHHFNENVNYTVIDYTRKI